MIVTSRCCAKFPAWLTSTFAQLKSRRPVWIACASAIPPAVSAAQATTGETAEDACPPKTGDPHSTIIVRRLNCSQRRRGFGVVGGVVVIE
jgi:hypothetical protein